MNRLVGRQDEDVLRTNMLREAHEHTKALVGSSVVTKGDAYIELLYLHARLCESLGTPKLLKTSHRSYQELFRLTTENHLFPKVISSNDTGWKGWHASATTWQIWATYFEGRSELTLAVDAHLEMMKRIRKTTFNVDSYSTEPTCSMHLKLAFLYHRAKEPSNAIERATNALSEGPYVRDVRTALTTWSSHPWT